MAKRTRTTRTRKPPEEKAQVYEYEGQNLHLVKTESLGCDGCYFDQNGRCIVGDEMMSDKYDCTKNGGDEIYVIVPEK